MVKKSGNLIVWIFAAVGSVMAAAGFYKTYALSRDYIVKPSPFNPTGGAKVGMDALNSGYFAIALIGLVIAVVIPLLVLVVIPKVRRQRN
ncbi:MAG: hypothetical protein LBI79_03940 [Nitrososphaerota archaeon]|jgi:hypothetical protein|nr:hypothetical protein [Nitrososphaerota archaeon]